MASTITITVPPELASLAASVGSTPQEVIERFITDLCVSPGSSIHARIYLDEWFNHAQYRESEIRADGELITGYDEIDNDPEIVHPGMFPLSNFDDLEAPPPGSFSPSNFDKVTRMDVAISILGNRVSEISNEMWIEQHKPNPDAARLAELRAQRIALIDRQEDLRPDHVEAVAAILGN